MSDASLIKNVPEMLSHPLVISVTASLGVHMLLVPILGDLLKNQKPKEESMVQVLELSPQQLNRVPKSAAPPLTLPAVPNAKTPSNPSIPSLFSAFPPPPPPLPSLESLKKIPTPPPLRSLPIKPLPSIGKYPLPLLNRKRPIITRGSFPIKLPPKPATALPAPPPRPQFKFDTESLNPGSFQTGSLPVFGNSTNQIPDPLEVPNQQPPVSVTPPAPKPQFSITPPPSEPTKPVPSSAVAIARQRDQNLVAQVRMRRKQLRKDVTNTTDEEARKNLVEWMALVKDTLPKKEVVPEAITVSATYPKDACIKKLEGTTVFGILVGANGEVTNAQLIQSAGYGILNQQALEDIQFRKFNNQTGTTKPYQVKVAFDYDKGDCPSLAVFQETANQPVPAKPNTVSGENAAANNPVIVVPKPETPSNNSANNNSTDNNRTVSVPVKPNSARENSNTRPRTISVPVRENTSSQDSTPKPRRVSIPVRDNTSTQENTPKPTRVRVPVRENTPTQENTPRPRAVPVQQNTPSQENTPKPSRVLVPVRDNTPSQENTTQENTTNTTAVPVKPAQATGNSISEQSANQNSGKESVPEAAATQEQNSQEDKDCKFKSRSARRRNRIDSFTTPSSRSCK